jgi:hypothetical protein
VSIIAAVETRSMRGRSGSFCNRPSSCCDRATSSGTRAVSMTSVGGFGCSTGSLLRPRRRLSLIAQRDEEDRRQRHERQRGDQTCRHDAAPSVTGRAIAR